MNIQRISSKKDIVIYADLIDSKSFDQVKMISEHPIIIDPVRIMPDVHAGAGCVIGFTGRGFADGFVMPNIVGVDIGCGVVMYKLPDVEIDFEKLDRHVRQTVPLGMNGHRHDGSERMRKYLDSISNFGYRDYFNVLREAEEFDKMTKFNKETPITKLGSLGGGNHFVEIDEMVDDGKSYKFIIVHSGSRNFGKRVADFYQKKAISYCKNMKEIPKGLEYLPGTNYMHHMRIAQRYAQLNRVLIIMSILSFFNEKFNPENLVESVHNYIDSEGYIRKGAISAKEGEKVIIPLNMAEGCLYGIGKGNPDFNFSAPHGAGRVKSRMEMKIDLENGNITMEQFHSKMKNNNVWTSSCNKNTIDESPMAYKKLEHIEEALALTVDVQFHMKSIYNLKA